MYTSSAKNRPGSVKPKEGEKKRFSQRCRVGFGFILLSKQKGGFLCRVASFEKQLIQNEFGRKNKQTKKKQKTKQSHCKFEHVPLATGVGGVKYAVVFFLLKGFGHSG